MSEQAKVEVPESFWGEPGDLFWEARDAGWGGEILRAYEQGRRDAAGIDVPLTEREVTYLHERASFLELPPGRVLVQALRVYQLWEWYPQLAERLKELMDAEMGVSPGCAGDD